MTTSHTIGVFIVQALGSVENGECGVWKMRGVENAGCVKCGVCKMRRKFQISVSISHSNAEKQCINNKKIKIKTKKRDASLHLRCAGLGC